MSKNAPDTRNKLDNNKGVKSKKKVVKKKTMKELHDTFIDKPMKTKVVKKESKGKAFKKEHGYSLTLHKLMKKYNCETLEEYRDIRSARKSAVKDIQKEKHKKAKAFRMANSKGKTKGKTPATKIKEQKVA